MCNVQHVTTLLKNKNNLVVLAEVEYLLSNIQLSFCEMEWTRVSNCEVFLKIKACTHTHTEREKDISFLWMFSFSYLPFLSRFAFMVSLPCSYRSHAIYYGSIILTLQVMNTVVNVKEGNGGNSSSPSQCLKCQTDKFIDLGTALLVVREPQSIGEQQTRDSTKAGLLRIGLSKGKMGLQPLWTLRDSLLIFPWILQNHHCVMYHIHTESQK